MDGCISILNMLTMWTHSQVYCIYFIDKTQSTISSLLQSKRLYDESMCAFVQVKCIESGLREWSVHKPRVAAMTPCSVHFW